MIRVSKHTLIDSSMYTLPNGGCVHVFIDYHKNSRLGFVLHHVCVSPDKCFHHSWKYKDDDVRCNMHMVFLRRKYQSIATPV